MKGDFTRDIFDPTRHYSRVLMQQGRVLVDDDWNVQSAIGLYHLRALAADLIGWHGGPADGNGFEIQAATLGLFTIGEGHYYVDGILCENDTATVDYRSQPDLPTQDPKALTDGTYLVYLDVWERHITSADDALVREVALGGPDTTTRARVVWQVKVYRPDPALTAAPTREQLIDLIRPGPIPMLSAQAVHDDSAEGPCTVSPDALYRGPENQLYRVEIHNGGTATGDDKGATFKWSRDNGSRAVFPVRTASSNGYVLTGLGQDDRSGLTKDDWVEVTDEDYEVVGLNERPLFKVTDVVDADLRVTLSGSPSGVDLTKLNRPMLRRWDQTSTSEVLGTGTIAVVEGKPIELEDGVQITFQAGGRYHPGMYWLIPARVETRAVEWPSEANKPAFREPRGVTHHLAPLAQVTVAGGKLPGKPVDYRRLFRNLCDLTASASKKP